MKSRFAANEVRVRRAFFRRLVGVLLGAFLLPSSAFADEPVLTDDGLYTQVWFLDSFLELRDDLDEAAAESRRFAIMWEQRGCPYCKETHFVNFADAEIRDFVESNFAILQLNIFGSRRVTDFDGEVLEERELARKYGVRFTPTIQFFPESSSELGEGRGASLEVARMPGYLRPQHFLAMFRFVQEAAYREGSFRSYLKRTRP